MNELPYKMAFYLWAYMDARNYANRVYGDSPSFFATIHTAAMFALRLKALAQVLSEKPWIKIMEKANEPS